MIILGRLIYKTSYEEHKAFVRYSSLAKSSDHLRSIGLRYPEEKPYHGLSPFLS